MTQKKIKSVKGWGCVNERGKLIAVSILPKSYHGMWKSMGYRIIRILINPIQ